MVLVLVIVIAFFWLKEEITCDHLEDGACETPDIS
jgi:hypothetical protein